MSNYTPTGNPILLSRGTSSLIRAENVLIQTAVTSKADHAGQVYTGTHDHTGAVDLVATQAAADNTTKAASTAHVFAERTNTATLTNKTLTTPVINSPTGLVKADVGLSNADNTSDANKPVSTATQTALDIKAPLASPALTGAPTAPTATLGDTSTQVSNSAFVAAAIATQLGGVLPVTAWVSGATYSAGNNVYSPLTFGSYRRITNGAGTTDPSLDPTNWISASSSATPDFLLMSLGVI